MSILHSYSYKGKHREPSKSSVKSLNAAALGLSIPFMAISPATAAADPPGGWGAIIACESGGKNIRTQIPGPYTASGYFQITNGTWRANGGGQYSATAMGATFAQQKAVANNIYENRGSLADWNASRSCWAGKQGAKVSIKGAVKAAPKAAPSTTIKGTVKPTKKVRTQSTPSGNYTVKPGDTLSGISPNNWQSVWKNNRVVIGSNPDLIFPGQVLKT